MIQNPDVVVIGAGAAGIGAGLALTRMGVPFVMIEAKSRIGGRAYSESESLGELWDHGCHWFHSADINPLRMIAERIGHGFAPQLKKLDTNLFMDGHWTTSPLRRDYVWRLLADVVQAGVDGRDVAASEIVDPSHRNYPMIRHWLQLMYSADPEDISTLDCAHYNDTGVNLPVRDGYGALVARLGSELPIVFNTMATRVEALSGTVRVTTDAGEITAKAAIIAVPARMLEMGHLTIGPQMPELLAEALQEIPMGWYEKVAFAFDRPVFEGFDPPYADIFDPVANETRPLNFELHPFGRPIAITHIAGKFARDLARDGKPAMADFALETLVRAFGSDIRHHITHSAVTGWTGDPHIAGAYACARPGKAHLRAVFLEPIHERVFLAGEHTHQSFMATAHGAYLSGLAAARRAAEKAGHAVGEDDPLWLPPHLSTMDILPAPSYMTA